MNGMNRNNAGKFSHGHGISEDGIEMTFATNYLGKQREIIVVHVMYREFLIVLV